MTPPDLEAQVAAIAARLTLGDLEALAEAVGLYGAADVGWSAFGPEMAEALLALGAERSACAWEGGKTIIGARLLVGGVCFRASYTRPSTEAEQAELSRRGEVRAFGRGATLGAK